MEWKQFEELTCALLEEEPGVETADLFHDDGQQQFGVDVLANLSMEVDVIVASCKCYEVITPGQVVKWSDAFLDNFDSYWKARHVRRFILAVASSVNGQKVSDEILRQKSRFRAIGVEYSVWGPRQFQAKLRPHRAIVGQYLDAFWVTRICGDVPVGAGAVAPSMNAVLDHFTNQVSPLLAALSGETDARLEQLRQRLREELPGPIEFELNAMRAAPHWHQLTANVRSKCIRYLASAKLQNGDIDGATLLADEADAVSTDGATTFRALLLARQGDHAGALLRLATATESSALELRAALLIENGKLDDAEQLIAALTKGASEPSVECLRLKAFILLFRHNREEALDEIQRAEARAPKWFAIRRAGAVIRYACALSNSVGPEHFANPSPVALELVREDDVSQARLKEALSIFEKLANERDATSKVTFDDDVWALACECNLLDGSGAAQQRCDKMLGAAPQFPAAISWALARGLTFDRARSIAALEKVIASSGITAGHVLACSWLLSLDGREADAKSLVEKSETLFRDEGQHDAYEARLASILDSRGDDIANVISSPEKRMFALLADTFERPQWERVEQLFAELATERPQSTALLAAAARLATGGQWEFLAKNIEIILRFETASAVEIAVHAAYNGSCPKLALEVLAANRNAFPHQMPPRNVRLIEVHALAAEGDHRTALNAAERLALEFGGPQERQLTADIRIGFGDVRGALPIIRAGLADRAFAPADALRFAQVAELEDEELARKLWQHAHAQGIPVELALVAHRQALRLGLEKEANVFVPTLAKLAGTVGSGAFVLTLEEFKERIAAWNQDRASFLESYLNGAAPFHVISQVANLSFGEHYLLAPSPTLGRVNAHGLPLLIRHGARALEFETGIPLGAWQLHADVSSLLLASQLGILESIEASVAAVFVPRSIQRQLFEMRSALGHPQPKRLAIELAIDASIREGRVQVYKLTGAPTGTAVESGNSSAFWILETQGERADTDSVGGQRTTLRGVVEGMRQHGKITESSYSEANERLSFADENGESTLPLGARVLFRGTSLELVVAACTLDAVLETYVVLVEEEFAAFCALETAQEQARQRSIVVLDEVRNHIAGEILSGAYRTLAVADVDSTERDDADASASMENLTSMLGLRELLGALPSTNAVFLCDDRYITGHPGFGPAPLVGIFEVLSALRRARKLSDAEYFEKLLQLRQASALFLPMSPEEVLFHLSRAPIKDGSVVETSALAVLRQYMARVALLEKHLKIGDYPVQTTERPDETSVLLSARRLNDDCITSVWMSSVDTDEQCAAKATWIWSSLRAERHLGLHPAIRNDIDSVRTFAAVNICSVVAILFQMVTGKAESRKGAFSRWLSAVVIKHRLDIDAELTDRIASQLIYFTENLFTPSPGEQPKSYSDATIAAYLRKAVDEFPPQIRERLQANEDVRRRLKTHTITVVTLGALQLRREKFLLGVRKALRHGKSKIKADDSKKRVTFERIEDGQDIYIGYDGQRIRICDPWFPLLALTDLAEVKHILTARRELFDCARPELEQVIDEILGLGTPGQRFDAADSLRRKTVAQAYADIEAQLREHGSLPLEHCVTPSPQDVYRHLHLEASTAKPFEQRWDAAAKSLVEEVGCGEAFLRLASLPIPLPPSFVERFMASSSEDKTSLWTEVIACGRQSPVHFFHALSLLGGDCNQELSLGDHASFASDVLDRWTDLSDAFGAVLSWVDSQAYQTDGWSDWSVSEQLLTVWYHSARLLSLLNRSPGSEKRISQYFKGAKSGTSSDGAFGGLGRSRDCAAPSAYVGVVFLYSGLNYVVASSGTASILSSSEWDQAGALMRVSDVTNPWLLASRESAGNLLATFLRVSRPVLPDSVVVKEEKIFDFEDGLLSSLEAERATPLHWIHLFALSRMGLTVANYARATHLVTRANLVGLASASGQELLSWRAAAGCVSLFGDDSARAKAEKGLIELASDLRKKHKSNEFPIVFGTDDLRAMELSELVEACVALSRSDVTEHAYQVIARLLLGIINAWPAARAAVSNLLATIYEESRLQENYAIWSAYVATRAMAG
ncbi:hypothetical protein A6V36_20465 [Paraburkholderia ginsengiterrae]|uniref:Uncharacterized protein n=1 Tax=Paraburkholderia ginsengiterrae TaxID=1462993 RepID=A0A1A9NDC8_9BURK|nr:hypothetical protein [Paraburkholderia ginsengiterrae]OAJ62749.1 hypothetical protein A6V36_20465 [Paraburkholderia ginsengiterrae]OAJ64410.1 hypothetical protein A6V37_19490 [Paraburkholderia ginsengiterrae]